MSREFILKVPLFLPLTLLVYFSPVGAANSAERTFIIVEFNSAARPDREDLPIQSAPDLIRRMKLADAQQDANERRYVAAKVSDWKSRFQIPEKDINLLHEAGTGPYIIEARREAITSIVADATWDGLVSVMSRQELLNFDPLRLNAVFKTADDTLLGEFIEAKFKNEVLYSVWNATNIDLGFSLRSDLQQMVVKNVASIALEKLDRLEQFLRRRGDRYLADLMKIDRIATDILQGYIAIESLPPSEIFPMASNFFSLLGLFDNLGLRMLMANEASAERIYKRWLAYHRIELELPNPSARVAAQSEILALLGHRSASVRNQFTLELARFIVEYEDRRRQELNGVPDERFVRLAMRIAYAQEEIERKVRQKKRMPPTNRIEGRERRFEIVQKVIQNAIPGAEIRLSAKSIDSPTLLYNIVDNLFRNDFANDRFGPNFSADSYRLALMRVLNSVILSATNLGFRDHLFEQTKDWFAKLRTKRQERELEPMIQAIEHKMMIATKMTCEVLFKSSQQNFDLSSAR